MSAIEGNRYQALADEITSILDKTTGYSNANEYLLLDLMLFAYLIADSRSCPLGRFIQIARKTARGIDPFVNMNAVINYGLWYHFGGVGEEAQGPTDLRQRYLDVFEAMMELNDDFLELLGELQRRPDKYFIDFMKNFSRHYGKARSEDTSSVQSKISLYVQMAGYCYSPRLSNTIVYLALQSGGSKALEPQKPLDARRSQT
ncbi:hypothetical protein M378DRAFT_19226 [Amanita muscaria Koide BX008]|uniref:Uncharacterized protein n=1 Tax=Amanita muscaria (strain Koide BX008) TaxID=946122 RepID=A0A0C2RV19_AMAMK|nr:hypothetical protein M378DRAFT_19226 [Amanita muscaria Koide BX008]